MSENKQSINLDRMENDSSIEIIKTFDGRGKACKNGAVMFGVSYKGTPANLFIQPKVDNGTDSVINHLNLAPVNSTVKISFEDYTFKVAESNFRSNEMKERNNNRDNQQRQIAKGMAFNNATRLVMSEHEFDGDIMKRVELIAKILPRMYEIALTDLDSNEEKLF